MTNEELETTKQVVGQLGYIAGGTIAIAKFLELRKTVAKEKSVGATKIEELTKKDKEMEKAIEDLQKSEAKQSESLIELKADHKQIMSLVLEWFKGNK